MSSTPLDQLQSALTSRSEVTTALCQAFADYPVMLYVLGESGDYAARLRTLIGFFVASRVLRKDAILTVSTGSEVSGVALCTLPGLPSPAELREVREETWAELGADARGRYDECVGADRRGPSGTLGRRSRARARSRERPWTRGGRAYRPPRRDVAGTAAHSARQLGGLEGPSWRPGARRRGGARTRGFAAPALAGCAFVEVVL